MELITADVYDETYKPRRWLRIGNADPRQWGYSYYEFRVGAAKQGSGIAPPQSAHVVPARGLFPVYSLEDFELSTRVIGFMGGSSQLTSKGLQLLASPFIDPGFPSGPDGTGGGLLEVAVANWSDDDVTLPLGSVLGKVVFFDLGADATERALQASFSRSQRFAERQQLAEAMREFAARVMPDSPHLAGPEVFPDDR